MARPSYSSLSLSPSLSFVSSPQPLRRPRASYSTFFTVFLLSLSLSGNRLVKVITLITHLRTKYTFSHLFFFFFEGGRGARLEFLSLLHYIPYRGRADSSRKFLLPVRRIRCVREIMLSVTRGYAHNICNSVFEK